MPQSLQDVFTAEEVARAAGVPAAAVRALIADGQVHPIPERTFLTADNAVKVGRTLRATMATSTVD